MMESKGCEAGAPPRDVAILCVGRELLKGNTLDRNANWMACRVESLGLRSWRFSTIDDLATEIAEEVNWILERGTRYLILTGGLGPTFDDMTLRCLAAGLGLTYEVDPRAEEMVRNSYQKLLAKGLTDTGEITPARLKMAHMPAGAVPLTNPLGAAPGMLLNRSGTRIFSFPGVPEEMRAMFTLHAEPLLRQEGRRLVRREREIEWPGKDESLIEEHVAAVTRAWPGLYVKSRVRGVHEQVRIRLTLWVEGEDEQAAEATLAGGAAQLRQLLGLPPD